MRTQHRISKPTITSRRPNRRIDEDRLAAHFVGSHGNTGDEDAHHGLYASPTVAHDDADADADADAVIGDLDEDGDGDGDGDADAEADPDQGPAQGAGQHPQHHHHHHHHHHGPPVADALEHSMAPMAPMTPSLHHHGHHPQDIHALTAPELRGHGLLYAAATASDLQQPPSPPPPVGSTMPAPQPLVAATDFQPNPSPPQPPPQPQPRRPQPHFQLAPAPPTSPPPAASQLPVAIAASAAPPPPPPPQQQQQQKQHVQHLHRAQSSSSPGEQDPPAAPQKTTEQMAQVSGYAGFKVDSAFAKRMSRDPGQRLAEQRREGQELNLVRRSNVEALFAQIAGSEAANSCTHCKKGQGPWTVCVVYSGQMMGSCANCWFNASGSRCSFHEKSQPPQPVATHPYAVPVALPGSGAGPGAAAAANGDPAVAIVGNGYVVNPTSPAQLEAAALWNASGAIYSHDAGVKGTVQSALLQVREATPYQRALIQVEVAAKQLALKIVEAEELAAGLGQGGEENGAGISAGHHEEQHHNQQQLHHHHEYDSPSGAEEMVNGRL